MRPLPRALLLLSASYLIHGCQTPSDLGSRTEQGAAPDGGTAPAEASSSLSSPTYLRSAPPQAEPCLLGLCCLLGCPVGQPCGTGSECRSGLCSPAFEVCVECNADSDCAGGSWCNDGLCDASSRPSDEPGQPSDLPEMPDTTVPTDAPGSAGACGASASLTIQDIGDDLSITSFSFALDASTARPSTRGVIIERPVDDASLEVAAAFNNWQQLRRVRLALPDAAARQDLGPQTPPGFTIDLEDTRIVSIAPGAVANHERITLLPRRMELMHERSAVAAQVEFDAQGGVLRGGRSGGGSQYYSLGGVPSSDERPLTSFVFASYAVDDATGQSQPSTLGRWADRFSVENWAIAISGSGIEHLDIVDRRSPDTGEGLTTTFDRGRIAAWSLQCVDSQLEETLSVTGRKVCRSSVSTGNPTCIGE